MTTYTEVFGGNNIYPSDVSYLAFNLSAADVTLSWPLETNSPADGTVPAARIMNINCTASSRKVYLPPANEASVGAVFLFSNTGNVIFSVVNNVGTVICNVGAGQFWQVYMTSNTTIGGLWTAYQFGATTSTANAGALAGAGLKAISTTLNQAITTVAVNSNYTLGSSDRAKSINWTGASGTLSFDTATTLGSDWFCYLRNSGSSAITLDPYSAELIDDETTLSIAPFDSCMILCDGVGFYTVGLTQTNPTGFDYLAIDVSGTGNYTLATFELDRVAYNLNGTLTGNRNVIVPATVQQYWITNATSGAYNLTVKTSAGTGIIIPQGEAQILYCDGTDVVQAQTSAGVVTPIPVVDGGTGSTTAGGALINLGGTSTGIAVFTAANQAAGRTAIDAIDTNEANDIAIQYAVALG